MITLSSTMGRRLRTAAVLVFAAGAFAPPAMGDGPIQPDPPIPPEARAQTLAVAFAFAPTAADHLASATASSAVDGERVKRKLDCNCAVLHARDLEGRVEGHVEQWQALHRGGVDARGLAGQANRGETAHRADATHRAAGSEYVPVHLAAYVEGVVGFPVRHYRLAADDAANPD